MVYLEGKMFSCGCGMQENWIGALRDMPIHIIRVGKGREGRVLSCLMKGLDGSSSILLFVREYFLYLAVHNQWQNSSR